MNSRVSSVTAFKRSRKNLSCTLKLISSDIPTVETRKSAPSGIHPPKPVLKLQPLTGPVAVRDVVADPHPIADRFERVLPRRHQPGQRDRRR